ncbi:MAG: class I mannose-6-phosphate isomerase [candidate division KSB1 bacterium]|nr:class I mannose-6-phosphate isomerase [candidate division KSB1 bacterium]MDZ7272442.1 class I mannose-6-phosphate isomerase [candidate division KSB1 bacterium]MDZ7284534.1 class I mannose-6-phosphate isomerase [candidate division KSB1 bacterium]MDZ7297070.1 class I mannose-6-phosphate isomerase [candidate division KSB1 bacterium]MDZ7308167.1 class I mannose-6-phosphate isomerase [candidate division KSB1 bacterium]
MANSLYPLTFAPVLKQYLWGGRNLERLGRTLPPHGVVAESWEISGHPNGVTAVDNGPFAGRLLTELHAELGVDLIGRNCAWAQARHKFPLLIKLLDAKLPLSVQVHPDDDFARTHEGNELGKTEMWVVLQAVPNAELILGVKAGTTPAAFRQAAVEGRLEPFLHRLPVKAGDHVCVPAGSLHAIMGGLLIAEIQQNSDTTYRVYDWNRVGDDGRPRPLHLDKAMAVINFAQVEPRLQPAERIAGHNGVQRWRLCANRYFVTERVEMPAGATFTGACTGESLEIWGVIAGTARINHVTLTAVRFALLPAMLGEFAVTTAGGATLLRIYVGA